MRKTWFLAPLLITASLAAQTTPTGVPLAANMVQVCSEDYYITASSVASFVAQFGTTAKTNGFESTFSFDSTIKLPFLVWYLTPPLNAFDPAPSLGKYIYAQQQAKAYTVTCGGTAITIPALPVVTPPPTPPPTTTTTTTTPTTATVPLGSCTLLLNPNAPNSVILTLGVTK